MKKLGLLFVLLLAALKPLAAASSNTFYLGGGENTWREAPTGANNWSNLGTTWMAGDSMPYDYIAHWFDVNKLNRFPAGCSSLGAASPLSSFQAVINANKKLFIFWWWVGGNVCNGTSISDSETYISSCLIPTLQALTGSGEVYVFLEPEYNINAGCNPAASPAWDTHFKNMITALHSATYAGGNIKVYAGPSPGGFGWDKNAYQIDKSIGPQTLAVADFIGFHSIRTRDDSYKSGEPNYPAWWTGSDEGLYFSRSISRYLRKQFNKPLMFGYWSHSNTPNSNGGPPNGTTNNAALWNTTEQNNSLTKMLQNRAFFQAQGDRSFGPFWYMDQDFAGEGLKTSGNVPYAPAFNTWKTYNTNVAANANTAIHSVAFEAPDLGDEYTTSIPVSWISRGRTATASTFDLQYSANGGAFTSVPGASAVAGNDLTNTAYTWTPCGLSPTADLRLRLVADDGVSVTSGTMAWKPAGWTSNANYGFESNITDWVPNPWVGTPNATLAWGTTLGFQGTHSLSVTADFNSSQWSYITLLPSSAIFYGGSSVTVTAHIYIPFSLNPTMGFGKVVSKVSFQMRDNAFTTSATSAEIGLEQGWNRVSWTFTGEAGGSLERLNVNVFNKWGVTGNPAYFIDEVKIGSISYTSGPGCGTPTYTATGTPTRTATSTLTAALPSATSTDTTTRTSTATPSATPTASPTRTASGSPSASPTYSSSATPSASRTASGSPSASASVSPTFTVTATWTSTATPTTSSTTTPTRTATGSPSASASVSPSPSASSSATPSASRTASPSATSTRTVTAPLTATDTPTVTPTPTETIYLGSATSTDTATSTATGTPVLSATSTSSATASSTPSSTATETLFLTPTPTGTVTPSSTETTFFTATDTPTISATATTTETPQDSPTGTSTGTPGPSDTVSPTSSATASPSATRTQTQVLPSATPTVTSTQTLVLPSATSTDTRTMTPTFTVTLSSTPGVAGTSTPGSAPGAIISTLPALNPHFGGPLQIAINNSGRVEKVQMRLYTAGYIFLTQIEQTGPWGSGWNTVSFPVPILPNGTYFYTVRGFSIVGPAGLARRGKLMVLR